MRKTLHMAAILCMFIPNAGMADHMDGTLQELMLGDVPRATIPPLGLPRSPGLPPVDTRMTPVPQLAPWRPQRLSPAERRHREWQRQDHYRSDMLRR